MADRRTAFDERQVYRPAANAEAERHPKFAASLFSGFAPIIVFALVSVGIFLIF